jgi:predicted amidophosphoribosyltransferase
VAAKPEPTPPAELNIVSGGHVACPSCGARILRFRGNCPQCRAAIPWDSVRIASSRRERRGLGRLLARLR